MTHPHVPLCLYCADSMDKPLPDEVVGHIRSMHPGTCVAEATALWVFEKSGPVQRIHRELKYGNRPYYGYLLGQLLGRDLLPNHAKDIDRIIPIPLHKKRLLERGYNQCHPIAEGLSATIDRPVDTRSLVRHRATRSQTNLSIVQRRVNLSSAFTVSRPQEICNQHIMVLDDVITTGATVTEAARVLADAGAASVTAVAIGFARI